VAQKWYEKASVQAAIVAGVFILLTAIVAPFVSNRLWPPGRQPKSSGSAAPVSTVPNTSPSSVKSGPSKGSVPPTSKGIKQLSKSPQVSINAPVQGSVVVSQGQTGGQVAGTINNYGPP